MIPRELSVSMSMAKVLGPGHFSLNLDSFQVLFSGAHCWIRNFSELHRDLRLSQLSLASFLLSFPRCQIYITTWGFPCPILLLFLVPSIDITLNKALILLTQSQPLLLGKPCNYGAHSKRKQKSTSHRRRIWIINVSEETEKTRKRPEK